MSINLFFGSLLRNEDHNQLEISNLLHWTRCKKEKMRGFKSSLMVEGDLTHMQLFLYPSTTIFPTILFSNHAFIKTETFWVTIVQSVLIASFCCCHCTGK